MNKTTPKNKASMELHTESQNAKKNANKQTNNCAQPMPKHCEKCKVKQTNKMHHYFCYFKAKKNSNNTEKKSATPKQ